MLSLAGTLRVIGWSLNKALISFNNNESSVSLTTFCYWTGSLI